MRTIVIVLLVLALAVPAAAQVKLHCSDGDKWVASASVLPSGCTVVKVDLPSITIIAPDTGDQALKKAHAAELDLQIQKLKRGDIEAPAPKQVAGRRKNAAPTVEGDGSVEVPSNLKVDGALQPSNTAKGYPFVPYYLTINGQVEQGPMPYTTCIASSSALLETLNLTDEAHAHIRELHQDSQIRCVKSDGREMGGGVK